MFNTLLNKNIATMCADFLAIDTWGDSVVQVSSEISF